MDGGDQRALTGAVIKRHSLDLTELWLDYVSLGGDASEQDLRDYASGVADLPAKDRDALSQAVNEHCATANLAVRVPYSDSPLTGTRAEPQDPYASK